MLDSCRIIVENSPLDEKDFVVHIPYDISTNQYNEIEYYIRKNIINLLSFWHQKSTCGLMSFQGFPILEFLIIIWL